MTRLLTRDNLIEVRVSEAGEPVSIAWQSDWLRVVQIFNQWKLETRWWDEENPISRSYYMVGLAGGLVLDVYRDAIRDGDWFIERVWD